MALSAASGRYGRAGKVKRGRTDLFRRHSTPTLPASCTAGLLMTLIDHALSAIAWEDADRRPCVTIQIDVRFLNAVRPPALVEARGRVLRRTATLSFTEGELRVGADVVVTASAILKIV